MREHPRPRGDGDGNQRPTQHGMDAAPDVGQHIFLLWLPDLGVVEFDDRQVNIHTIPKRAVFASAVLDLLRFHAAGPEHDATDADDGDAPEDGAFRAAAVADKLLEEKTPSPKGAT